MRALPTALLVLLPTLLAVPPAHAQAEVIDSTISVSVLDPGGTGLAVGAESGVIVTFNYDAGAGRRQGLDPTGETGTTPTRVRFEVVSKPSWVNATRFVPPVVNLTLPATTGNAAGNTTLLLTVAADAPARVREPLVVKAIAEPNGNIRGSSADSQPLPLRARVVTKVNVTAGVESPVFLSGGRWASVPFVVRNDGNDEVTMLLNVTTRPEDSQIDLDNKTLVLPRGGSATVEVGLRMPWTYGSLGTLELEAQPLSDDEEPPAARASVDVNARSAAPGPSAAWVALAGAGIALLARRR